MAKRETKPVPPTVIRVCAACGEVFETNEDRDTCPGECLHRWGRGNDDPASFDDYDAFRKAPKEKED